MFGAPLEGHAAADEDFFFRHEMRPSIEFVPDLDALRTGGDPDRGRHRRGVGRAGLRPYVEGAGPRRSASSRCIFPGDHIGFAEDPDGFAPALRPFLTA